MAHRAIDALQEQTVEDREFCTGALRFDRRRTEEAKKVIREFREAFVSNFASDGVEDVAQVNVQFFFHTSNDPT